MCINGLKKGICRKHGRSNINEAMARLLFYSWWMWNRRAMLSCKPVHIFEAWEQVGENWLCCAQWTGTKWSGSAAHLRAPSTEPVVCLTPSLTCGCCCRKAMPLSAWLETISKRLYEMMAWKTSLGLSLHADGNTIDHSSPVREWKCWLRLSAPVITACRWTSPHLERRQRVLCVLSACLFSSCLNGEKNECQPQN